MENKTYKQKPKIVVSRETKIMLNGIGNKGDTYDDIIKRLIKLKEVKK